MVSLWRFFWVSATIFWLRNKKIDIYITFWSGGMIVCIFLTVTFHVHTLGQIQRILEAKVINFMWGIKLFRQENHVQTRQSQISLLLDANKIVPDELPAPLRAGRSGTILFAPLGADWSGNILFAPPGAGRSGTFLFAPLGADWSGTISFAPPGAGRSGTILFAPLGADWSGTILFAPLGAGRSGAILFAPLGADWSGTILFAP